MVDAVKKNIQGVDFDAIKSMKSKGCCKEKGVQFEDRHERGDILSLSLKNLLKKTLYSLLL